VMNKSVIVSRADGSDDYDLTSMGSPPKSYELEDGQIQVVTVVEQEAHRKRDSRAETDSTKGLVRETFYRGDSA